MTEKSSRDFERIRENIECIRENIALAAAASGRRAEDIRLMAVTKTVGAEYVNQAILCGIDLIGENRVQELLSKIPSLRLDGVEKHLIGHLQTNKVRQITGIADMIQSVDSVRLAAGISKEAQRAGICSRILLEVNIGKEEAKSGIMPDALMENLYEISQMSNILICGLMAIPPICENAGEIRAYFHDMRKLFIDIQGKKIDNVDMSVLSMGMSEDYEEAVMEGSTMVRIGSLIFGNR